MSPDKLLECVPNISAGRDRGVVEAVAAAVRGVGGVRLLDVDSGAATNRTVFTFAGAPEAVLEGAFVLIKTARELIDMRTHSGEHPRIGATDVCPFVPLAGATMADCVAAAGTLGARVARELGIPVYLYESAARSPRRKNLADIRAGEYEGLKAKLADPAWAPDFAPAIPDWERVICKSGATVIGARPFLIACNVNFNTRDEKLARDIALELREAGRAKRDARGAIVKKPDGTSEMVPGRLKAVKGVGWFIPEFARAQLSVNLTDLEVTPLHVLFEAACAEAEKRGLRVTGSEIVGLAPKRALLEAGKHFLARQGKTAGVPEAQVLECAIQSLGLRDLGPFDPGEKIIEEKLAKLSAPAKTLRALRVREFADELSSDSPAPGGGSAAALAGALGAGLTAMVAALAHAKPGFEALQAEMDAIARAGQADKDAFLLDVDRDTDAFNAVLAAIRLPKKTAAEKAARETAMDAASRGATEIPLQVLERAAAALERAGIAAGKGNPDSVSDAGVGALLLLAGAEGAYDNVRINLKGLPDSDWKTTIRRRAAAAIQLAREHAKRAREAVERGLNS